MLFVCLLFSNKTLDAQYPVLQKFTVSDGLPGSLVYASMQDSKGYIWSGTDRGVTRFDGHEFKLFTIKDGLPSNDVWRISEDHKGRLWLSTFGGNCYYEDGRFKIWNDKLFLTKKPKVIRNHRIFSSGHFIFTSKMGEISFLDREDSILNLVPLKDYLTSNEIFYIHKNDRTAPIFEKFKPRIAYAPEDDLWLINETVLVDNDQLIMNQLRKWTIREIKGYVSISENLGGIIYRGELWTIGHRGLNKINMDEVFKIEETKYIQKVDKFAPNRIWIQTKEKSYVVDTLFQVVPDFDFINSLSVNNILLDQQNNCWISTPYGLFFLNQNAITSKTYSAEHRVSPNSINQLAVDKEEEVWGLDIEGYLYRLIPGEGLRLMSKEPLMFNAKDLLFDQKGDLWIGGNNFGKISKSALSRGDLLTNAHVETDLFENYRAVKRIHFDRKGRLLISTHDRVRAHDDLSTKKEILLYKERFYDIASLNNGNIWLAGKNGLMLISKHGDELKEVTKKFGRYFKLPTDHIAVDREQNLWFAANYRGLYYFDGERMDSIPELKDMLIRSLYIDGKDQIWAATNKGVIKVSNIKRNPFRYDFRQYSELEGLASRDVKDIIVVNDQIYATTEKGLTVLKDFEQSTVFPKAPLFFSNIEINGKDTLLSDYYELKNTQNNILIQFRSFDYQNMGSMVFEYKMEGIDAAWKELNEFSKEYSLLSPGSYIFKLREKDTSALAKPREISIEFIIHPPIWKKGWFIILCLFSFGLLIYGIVKKKIKEVEKKAEEENQLHRRFAELELNALQSQMNPHFIFNALHAIQDFIFKKDERVANRYLVKFSRLMRLFLESSKEKYIILDDEIQLLQLYIELEQLRFEDQFEFEVKISPELTSSMIEIPSMLLQPFVENAINHGLIHLKNGGELLLEFSEKGEQLFCVIQDNGIGRKKAMAIKETSVKSYKSRGLQLMEERQRVWNIIGNTNVDIVIKDLYDSENIACGTRVEILINTER